MDGGFAGDADRRTVLDWLMDLTQAMQPMEPAEKPQQTHTPSIQINGGHNVVVAGDVNITRSTLIGARSRARHKLRTSWRTLTIAAILAHCAHNLRDEHFYASFVRDRFGKESLADLADAELLRVQRYVFSATPH